MTLWVMDVDDIFHISKEKARDLEDAFKIARILIENGTQEIEIKHPKHNETIHINASYCEWIDED